MEEYEEPNPFFDESIEDYYYKEISKTINIQDSDAEYAPYSFESQKQLYRYTEKIIEVIESAKNEENSDEVEEIVEETKFLQETLSKSTKKQVFERLKKIWAKTWKFSYEIFKEIIVNLAAEYIKGILNGNTFLL